MSAIFMVKNFYNRHNYVVILTMIYAFRTKTLIKLCVAMLFKFQ